MLTWLTQRGGGSNLDHKINEQPLMAPTSGRFLGCPLGPEGKGSHDHKSN